MWLLELLIEFLLQYKLESKRHLHTVVKKFLVQGETFESAETRRAQLQHYKTKKNIGLLRAEKLTSVLRYRRLGLDISQDT